jgi:hypothetical protein
VEPEKLVLMVSLEVMEGERFHLLVRWNEHVIVKFPWREEGVELRLGLVLEVVQYFVVP